MSTGTAYHEYLRNAAALAKDKMQYHQMLADRSVIPRRILDDLPRKTGKNSESWKYGGGGEDLRIFGHNIHPWNLKIGPITKLCGAPPLVKEIKIREPKTMFRGHKYHGTESNNCSLILHRASLGGSVFEFSYTPKCLINIT